MPKKIVNAKIACLDFSLQKAKLKLGVQVLITNPEKLDGIRQRESDITKEKVLKILGAGANVILVTGGIDDLCLKVCSDVPRFEKKKNCVLIVHLQLTLCT